MNAPAAAPAAACPAHPAVFVSRECAQCRARACDRCSAVKDFGRTKVEVCARCGGLQQVIDLIAEARDMGDRAELERLRGKPFWQRPLDLLRFPFTSPSGGVAMLCFGAFEALVMGNIVFAPGGLLVWLIFNGLVFSYAGFVVRRVDLGDERIPPPGDTAHMWDDGYAPFFRMLVVAAPALTATVVAVVLDRDAWVTTLVREPWLLLLFLYGVVMLPGALLQAAHEGSFWQLVNPFGHARVALREPASYAACAILTIVVSAAYLAAHSQLKRLGFVGLFVDGALNTYVVLVLARMYGLFLRELR